MPFSKGHKINVGKHWKVSDIGKHNMSLAKKGQPSPNKGKKASPELRQKMSDAHKGYKQKPESIAKMVIHQQGSKSHFWKDGRTSVPGYRTWQKQENQRRKRCKDNGSHTFGEWDNLKAQYDWTCPCCHKSEPEVKLSQDHIIPVSKGGSNNIENIQPLCMKCNLRKMTKIIKYPIPEVIETSKMTG